MRRLVVILLILDALVVLFALAGTYALFNNLPVPAWDYNRLAWLLGFVNVSLGIAAALLHMSLAQGWRRAFLLLALCTVLAGGIELLGTGTGFPFGRYEYTDRFGPRFLGLVPYFIPPSWFMMLYPALSMAHWLRLPRWSLGLAASALLTLWDVAMEAAMTTGWAYWVWQQPGGFYDMPYVNWLGWYLTGLLVAEAYLRLAPGWKRERPLLPLALYTVQSLFQVGMALLYGRPWAAVWWGAGYTVLLAALCWQGRQPTMDRPVEVA